MVGAVVLLTCLVSAAGWCLVTRSAVAAWVLVALAASWLPANNGYLEGHNLITLSPTHGITQGDCVGVVGWLVGMTVLLMKAARTQDAGRQQRIAVVAVIGSLALTIGALVAYSSG